VTPPEIIDEPPQERRKYYVDGGYCDIETHLVYDLDPDGKVLKVVEFTDYTAEEVRRMYTNAAELRAQWTDGEKRAEVIERLENRGIDFEFLAETTGQPDADPFDLLCHVAYNAPLRTRRERAERLRKDRKDFFDSYGPEARAILEELLEKYSDHGTAQFRLPDILRVPPISEHGNVSEIAGHFGGAKRLREAVNQLQALLYAA